MDKRRGKGNYLELVDMKVDCDGDTLLIQEDPKDLLAILEPRLVGLRKPKQVMVFYLSWNR